MVDDREFSHELRAFILRRVSSPDDAEDIVQLAFLRMNQGLADLRNRDRLVAWMDTVTRNAITDHYRSASHRDITCALFSLDCSPVTDAVTARWTTLRVVGAFFFA